MFVFSSLSQFNFDPKPQPAIQLLMATDQLMVAGGPRYVQMKSSPPPSPPAPGEISPAPSFRQGGAEPPNRIFDELPKATIVSVSRPDAGDISPMQLSYTIQVQYKQVRRILVQF